MCVSWARGYIIRSRQLLFWESVDIKSLRKASHLSLNVGKMLLCIYVTHLQDVTSKSSATHQLPMSGISRPITSVSYFRALNVTQHYANKWKFTDDTPCEAAFLFDIFSQTTSYLTAPIDVCKSSSVNYLNKQSYQCNLI